MSKKNKPEFNDLEIGFIIKCMETIKKACIKPGKLTPDNPNDGNIYDNCNSVIKKLNSQILK